MHRPAIAAALFAALLAAGCGSSTTPPETGNAPAPTEAAAPVNTEAPAATEAPKTAGVGDPVKVGEEATWTVTKVTDLGQELKSSNQFIDSVKTSGRFIQVDATIKAEGKDGFTILSHKIKDSQGREFDTKSEAMMVIEGLEACALTTVNPGLEQSCNFIYELPADATGLMFMAAGGMMDQDVPISLGQ